MTRPKACTTGEEARRRRKRKAATRKAGNQRLLPVMAVCVGVVW